MTIGHKLYLVRPFRHKDKTHETFIKTLSSEKSKKSICGSFVLRLVSFGFSGSYSSFPYGETENNFLHAN